MDNDSKVDEPVAEVAAESEPAPTTGELVPHPVDVATADLPPKQQNAFMAVKDWVEERLAAMPRTEMEDSFKRWVREELRLAFEGHSEETREQTNP